MDQQGHDMMRMAELPGLGRYVQERRRDLDLRYDELAARLGADVAWVYWLEDDVLAAIELDMLVRLAVALEVDQAIMMHHARLPPHHTGSGRLPHESKPDDRIIPIAGEMGQESADG
jgi:transcriptional regulator with XRE-family HTH domain